MSPPVSLPHDWFPRPLPPNVEIGPRSWLYSSYAFIHFRSERPRALSVGHDTGLYHGTFFDLGPDGEVQIGDYTTLVGAIVACNSRVVIGDYVFIAHQVVLADTFAATPAPGGDEVAGERRYDRPQTSIVIEDDCWIGARAVLLRGAHIGQGAIVGAAALIDFAVPPLSIVAGNPARIVGWCKRTVDGAGAL